MRPVSGETVMEVSLMKALVLESKRQSVCIVKVSMFCFMTMFERFDIWLAAM